MYIYISGLLLLLKGLQISAEYMNASTENTFNYSFYTLYEIESSMFSFMVKAEHDADLVFTYQNNLTEPYYEIMLGGWNNTKSVIRKNGHDTNEAEAQGDVLRKGEFRKFSVSLSNGKLKVFYRTSATPFLECDAPGIRNFLYMGIRTSWGATGSWKLFNIRSKAVGVRYTDWGVDTADSKDYKFYTLYEDTMSYNFQVRADHDAHVVFTTKRYLTSPRFEVMLGAYDNTKAIIRKNGNDLTETEIDNVLSGDTYHRFTVDRSNGKIRVFRDSQSEPFLEHDAPQMQSVLYMGIRTCWGANGSWILESVKDVSTQNSFMQPVFITNGWSNFYCYRTNGNRFFTFIKAAHDAYIRLFAAPGSPVPWIDILLGVDENQNSVIYINEENKCKVSTPNVLNSNYDIKFYLKWKDGTLSVAHEETSSPIITCTIPADLTINFHSIRTGPDVEGTWSSMSDDEEVTLQEISGYWVEVDELYD